MFLFCKVVKPLKLSKGGSCQVGLKVRSLSHHNNVPLRDQRGPAVKHQVPRSVW